VAFAAITAAFLVACGSTDSPADPDGGDGATDAAATADAPESDPWAAVRAAIDDHEIVDVTLLIGDADGTLLVHEKGASTADTEYRIASATKWITAATIMTLVEDGTMSLSDNPQDYIQFWTSDSSDARSRVTLEQLLSFTSGYRGRPGLVPCATNADSSLDACVQSVYANYHQYEPGTTYFYGPAHMHTAGLMAELATGSTWQELVVDRVAEPLGFEDTVSWALAGPDHPMPSGGLRTSGASYARFLQAIAAGDLVAGSRADMAAERTSELVIAYTPIDDTIGPWTYALGQWRECDEATWTTSCDQAQVSSSPGAFGFYPWYDHVNGYWAVLALELPLNANSQPTRLSVPLGQSLQPLIVDALAESD
jgi:CubicO group peptidase (beta-lactamase class C family)